MSKTEEKALFVDTLAVNVDNPKLSDADFRKFVRDSLAQFTCPANGGGMQELAGRTSFVS